MASINEISDLYGLWSIITVVIIAGMIISLLGIKIWRFKRRLNFKHTSAHNDDLNSSTSTQSMLKDKRQSRQVSDSVVVHGIFRKRSEDEQNMFERPKKLPPIRIPARLINSGTMLIPPIPPPRLKLRSGTSAPEIRKSVLEQPTYISSNANENSRNNNTNNDINITTTTSKSQPKSKLGDQQDSIASSGQYSDMDALQTLAIQDITQVGYTVQEKKDLRDYSNNLEEFLTQKQDHQVQQSTTPPIELIFEDLKNFEVYSSDSNEKQHKRKEDIDRFHKQSQSEIHEEFEMRRQSYQKNEGHLFELKEVPNQEPIFSPVGFGKSIDEDWENFQNLNTTKFNEMHYITTTTNETMAKLEENKTNFGLNELQTVTEPDSYSAYNGIVHVQKTNRSNDQFNIDRDTSVNDLVIIQDINRPQKPSVLKEPFATFVGSANKALSISSKACKLRAHQKVTFDVHTEEYYLPESDSDSFTIDENTNMNSNDYKNNSEYNLDDDVNDNDNEIVKPVPRRRTTILHVVDMETDIIKKF